MASHADFVSYVARAAAGGGVIRCRKMSRRITALTVTTCSSPSYATTSFS